MKKIILILMLMIGCLSFSEKLHTNKKLNWDKIEGKWFNGFYEFKSQKGQKFIIMNDVNGRVVQKLTVQGYVLKDTSGGRYAYDVKHKTVVAIDNANDIVVKFSKKYVDAN